MVTQTRDQATGVGETGSRPHVGNNQSATLAYCTENAVILVGCLLPWGTVLGISVSGLATGGGRLTFALALVGAGLALWNLGHAESLRRMRLWQGIIGSLLVAVTSINLLSIVTSEYAGIVAPGSGLLISFVGSVAVLGTAIFVHKARS